MTETADERGFLWMTPGDKAGVLLSVIGENRTPDSDETETVRIVTVGTLSRLGDGWRLTYTESDPDGSSSQQVDITVRGGRIQMERTGDCSTTMVFEKGKRFDGSYRTPWGDLSMGIYTTQVSFSPERDKGLLKLVYQVDIQGRFTAMHDLTLSFASND